MQSRNRKNITRRKSNPAMPIQVSKESLKLLEYIESIGVTRSTFKLHKSSEPRLKLGALHIHTQ